MTYLNTARTCPVLALMLLPILALPISCAVTKRVIKVDERLIVPGTFHVGPQSRNLVYISGEPGVKKKRFVVLNGVAGKTYQDIKKDSIVFSPDGTHLAFAARKARAWHVINNGVKGPPHGDISGPSITFSPDGSHMGYATKDHRRNKWTVVLNGHSYGPYDVLISKNFTFSPDGSAFAFGAGAEGLRGPRFVVRVGTGGGERSKEPQRGPLYEDIMPGTVTLSGNGDRLAYGALRDGKWFVVLGGTGTESKTGVTEFGPFEKVKEGSLTFSPGGNRLAFAAKKGVVWHVFVDGTPGKGYQRIAEETITFSPDGKRLAYAALKMNRLVRVLDGKEGRRYDKLGTGSLVFTKDSRHLAYAAAFGESWFVVVDGKEGRRYGGLIRDSLHFTGNTDSDGNPEVTFAAGRGKRVLVVRGDKETLLDEDILRKGGARVVIDPEGGGRYHYIVKKGLDFFIVEE